MDIPDRHGDRGAGHSAGGTSRRACAYSALGTGVSSPSLAPCRTARRSATMTISPGSSSHPERFRLPPAFAIPAEKPPGTFRIFIVGESAAVGVPEPSYSFGRYLEVMLRDRFPSTRFEVINTAITSVNSHVLLPAVRDLARRNGDLFIMYIGNNEVVGPYGAGTTLTRPGGSLALIRAGILPQLHAAWAIFR